MVSWCTKIVEKRKCTQDLLGLPCQLKGTYICSHSRKNIFVSWELYFAFVITATASYQGQSAGFSITFWTTFQDAFWLETLITNLILFHSRRFWAVMISVRKKLRKYNLLELAQEHHNSMDNLKSLWNSRWFCFSWISNPCTAHWEEPINRKFFHVNHWNLFLQDNAFTAQRSTIQAQHRVDHTPVNFHVDHWLPGVLWSPGSTWWLCYRCTHLCYNLYVILCNFIYIFIYN